MGESEEKLKSLLMKGERKEWKSWLKIHIEKTKIMASGPITSWQIDGETMETVTDFIFLDSKTTVDVSCNHEIKRHLLLGRKAITNLDSVLKSRDITLSTKVHLVKAMVVRYVMYGYESWTIKKAKHRKLMLLNCGVGEDSRESLGLQGDPTSPSKGNQSWVFIVRIDADIETSILWPPVEKNWLIWEDLMRNAGLKETQLELRLPGEISITSDMQMTPPLWQKVKRN